MREGQGGARDAANVKGEANPSQAAKGIHTSSPAWPGPALGFCPVEMPPEAAPDQIVAIPLLFLLRDVRSHVNLN